MATITFLGVILPTIVSISVTPHRFDWSSADGFHLKGILEIARSKIKVQCDTNDLSQPGINETHKRVLAMCRANVDLFSFQYGRARLVILESVIRENGELSPLDKKIDNLEGLVTVFKETDDFEKVRDLLATQPSSMIVLNDLIDGLMGPNHTPTHCARAVEGIRHLVAGSNVSNKKLWEMLRTNLNLSETYIKYITNISFKPRHGDPEFIDSTTVSEILERSWVIMNRYLEFLKRGRSALPPDKFAML